MIQLMRPASDEWGIKELQNGILNIAQYFNNFCEENGIAYCLMGGSALGAIRHKGFIPWDDDLDVFMRPDDYRRFRQLFSTIGNKNDLYLQEWGKSKNGRISLAKLRLNKSTYIEPDLKTWDINQGIYIDIFILHTCPDNKLKRWWQYAWSKYLVAKGAANRKYNKKSGIVGFAVKLLSYLPKRFLVNFATAQVYMFENEGSEYFCHFLGRAVMKTGLYRRKYFESTKKVAFETTTLRIPGRCEEYLKDRWGDYMKLPPLEEIKKYQHAWRWSDKETFPGYKKDNNYTDEKNLLA